MDYNLIIKDYSEDKKDKIVELVNQNILSMKGNMYHKNALNYFFNLWHEHFPQQKQSKHCENCRKAVCKFFHNVAEHIVSERVVPEPVEAVKTLKKSKTKAKKEKNKK